MIQKKIRYEVGVFVKEYDLKIERNKKSLITNQHIYCPIDLTEEEAIELYETLSEKLTELSNKRDE